ncbi:unnamed protein product, partial [Mesorhabditis spiculigera]
MYLDAPRLDPGTIEMLPWLQTFWIILAVIAMICGSIVLSTRRRVFLNIVCTCFAIMTFLDLASNWYRFKNQRGINPEYAATIRDYQTKLVLQWIGLVTYWIISIGMFFTFSTLFYSYQKELRAEEKAKRAPETSESDRFVQRSLSMAAIYETVKLWVLYPPTLESETLQWLQIIWHAGAAVTIIFGIMAVLTKRRLMIIFSWTCFVLIFFIELWSFLVHFDNLGKPTGSLVFGAFSGAVLACFIYTYSTYAGYLRKEETARQERRERLELLLAEPQPAAETQTQTISRCSSDSSSSQQ